MRAPVLLLSSTVLFSNVAAQTICNPLGNVAIYSNYDGGDLNIVVDQNVPDLHIGIVSYEFSRITISGAFAANVVAVWYAGYNADNDHCSLGGANLSTTVTGVPANIVDIQLYPPATWPNANGNGSIICGYTCDVNTSQGGCNTADQIAHYFLSNWGGDLRYHFTQYGCWNSPYAVSDGGNCCEDPLSTAVLANSAEHAPTAFPNPAHTTVDLGVPGQVEVTDATGRAVILTTDPRGVLDVVGLTPGVYTYRMIASGGVGRFVVER